MIDYLLLPVSGRLNIGLCLSIKSTNVNNQCSQVPFKSDFSFCWFPDIYVVERLLPDSADKDFLKQKHVRLENSDICPITTTRNCIQHVKNQTNFWLKKTFAGRQWLKGHRFKPIVLNLLVPICRVVTKQKNKVSLCMHVSRAWGGASATITWTGCCLQSNMLRQHVSN